MDGRGWRVPTPSATRRGQHGLIPRPRIAKAFSIRPPRLPTRRRLRRAPRQLRPRFVSFGGVFEPVSRYFARVSGEARIAKRTCLLKLDCLLR